MVLVISDNKDFESVTVIKDKGQYILIRGSLHQEDITIRSMYKPNNRAPKHRQILIGLKGKSGAFTIINGGFNTSLSVTDRTFRQKSFRGLEQHYKAIKPNRYTYNISTAEYTFFSSTHRIFSMIDYILRHKTNLINIDFKKAIQYIFSDHSGMTLPKIMEGKLKTLLI